MKKLLIIFVVAVFAMACKKEIIDNVSFNVNVIKTTLYNVNDSIIIDTMYIDCEKKIFIYELQDLDLGQSFSQFFNDNCIISRDGKRIKPYIEASLDVCGYFHISSIKNGSFAVVYCKKDDDYWIGRIGGFNTKIHALKNISVTFKESDKNSKKILILEN